MTPRAKRNVDLKDRDFLLLRGLFEARVMRLSHIAKLYFEGREAAARKRVQKLKAARFLREQRGRRAYQAASLSLTRQAFEALVAQGALSGYPAIGWKSLQKRLDVSEITLKHEWNVMDVKAALTPAIEGKPGLSVTQFSVWPRLCEFAVRKHFDESSVVKPDGFFRVADTQDGGESEHLFFLEVDRGSEKHLTLVEKVSDYWDYYESGDLATRLGVPAPAPFRVLMVLRTPARRQSPSIERRNNVAEQLSLAGVKTFVWLTTLEEIVADPLGAIWTTPGQFADVTRGTPFEPRDRGDHRAPYVRRPERERLVEERLDGKKLRLFG